MLTYTLDTHKAVKQFMAAGTSEKSAEAIVQAICDGVRTRDDLPMDMPPCDTHLVVKNLMAAGWTKAFAETFIDVYCDAVGYQAPEPPY